MVDYPFNFAEGDKLKESKNKNKILNDKLKKELSNDEEFKEEFKYLLLRHAFENINEQIKVPEQCKALVNEYIEDNNPVLSFLQNRF